MTQQQSITLDVWFESVDDKTPTMTDAVRGSFSPTILRETGDQLKAGLIWGRCTFCGGYVLVLAAPDLRSRQRERCRCGAKRLCRGGTSEKVPYQDGWRKDGIEWVGI